mgnify:CR=1 FL=1
MKKIREKLQSLQRNNWEIHFTWVKAHVGNEMADRLAKEAATSTKLPVNYNLIPKCEVRRELRAESLRLWESEWQATANGELTKSFFPMVTKRFKTNFSLSHNMTAIFIGHG